jgi:tetrapyrrole methylase family protein/MazG family protein
VYDSADSFDEVYTSIVQQLIAAAHQHSEILYAVPGSPLVLERTVALLRSHPDIEVVLHPAISFLDDAWRALQIDPVESRVQLIDGHVFAEAIRNSSGPFFVAHTHANWVLSDIKLSIPDPDPATPVVLVHHVGLPDERIVHTTWFEMDRTLEADHLTSLYIPSLVSSITTELEKFHELARVLRAQCPWDQEQTHASLVRYLIEETYELVDAINARDNNDAEDADLIEELGDVLYQVAFHAAIAEEQVLKRSEKPERIGIFDGIAESSPSLMYATKAQQRASRIGFDWKDISGPIAKVTEELQEVQEARELGDTSAVTAEIGDLLFAVVNVARHLDIDPESALRSAVLTFRSRVDAVNALAVNNGQNIAEMSLVELDQLWEVVKKHSTH